MMFRRSSILAPFAAAALALLPVMARAQAYQPMMPAAGPDNAKPAALENIGIDQKLNAQVPADLVFHDETGKDVKLGDYYGKRPFILVLVYFDCPQLCTVVLNDLLRSLNAMQAMSIGHQFDVLTVSFDPHETSALAAEKKKSYLRSYGRDGAAAGWHFLTGSQESITKLADTVGFRYTWDPQYKQFIHASGLMILTPNGRVSRYFYGIDYDPMDLRLALDEAAGDKIGSAVEQVLLYCFHYDPKTGKYAGRVDLAIKASGALTV
ncbi:MAG: SCO family protein, partial [Phycisphaerae bacterium]|nr:SCO family protein [Phycisphaerae bacterium]